MGREIRMGISSRPSELEFMNKLNHDQNQNWWSRQVGYCLGWENKRIFELMKNMEDALNKLERKPVKFYTSEKGKKAAVLDRSRFKYYINACNELDEKVKSVGGGLWKESLALKRK